MRGTPAYPAPRVLGWMRPLIRTAIP